jgi:methionyl-tRNA formyltransferase
MRVVFFGTPRIAAEVLTHLLKNGVNVVGVISKPDKPHGRSSTPVPVPVKVAAQAWPTPIPVYQPEKVSAPEFAPILQDFQADLFVVVAYGEILKQHVLDMPKAACINMHASLLPKYRGAAPIQRAIIQGEAESGVTIMHMVKQMDAGDMIAAAKIPIGPDMTAGELEAAVTEKGSGLLLGVIREFEQGTPPRLPQDHSQMTLAPKIELADCEVHWNSTAQAIHNLIRGSNPEPGAWCQVMLQGQTKRLRLFRSKVRRDLHGRPGELLSYGKPGFIIACQEGALELLELQLEGKKRMPAADLMRGFPADAWAFSSG